MGHPGYKFYDDYNTYEKRCLHEDPTGAKLIFPEAEAEIVELEVYLSELKEKEDSKNDKEKDARSEDNEFDKNEKEDEDCSSYENNITVSDQTMTNFCIFIFH